MQHKEKDSLTKQDFNSSAIPSTPSYTKLNALAEGLLKLPRPIKQAILLVGDYIVSIVCLFLALSLRQGVLDVNASPLLVSLYALVPILELICGRILPWCNSYLLRYRYAPVCLNYLSSF